MHLILHEIVIITMDLYNPSRLGPAMAEKWWPDIWPLKDFVLHKSVLDLLYGESTRITTLNVRAEHYYAPTPSPIKRTTLDKKYILTKMKS